MDETGKRVRWQLQLLEFHLQILHWAGITHKSAEALSTLSITEVDNIELEGSIPIVVPAQTNNRDEKRSAVPDQP